LEADARFTVVAAVSSGAGLVELVEESAADVVLLDVRMPGGGPAAAQQLTDRFGRRVVLIAVSAQLETATVFRMLRAGTTGYLPKGRLGASMPDLVARCAEGELVLAVPTGGAALHQLLGSMSRPGC
jgi:two-component system nitrate/nitrite response regulator NarL